MHERAQLFTETQVVAKDGKSQGSFGADSSDYSQVGHVNLKGLFFTPRKYTLFPKEPNFLSMKKCHIRSQISFGGGGGQEESDCTTPLRKPGFHLLLL